MIDFHTHLFPPKLFDAVWKWFDEHAWPIRYKLYAEDVARSLKEQGVERFVLLNYSHKPGMSAALNSWTREFCRGRPEIVPFAAAHPEDDGVAAMLDRCFRDEGFRGLKFHCHVTGIRPDDERMFPIYEKLVEYDRILMLHSGVGPSLRGYKETTKDVSGAAFTGNMLKRFPKLKVIVPHLGADEIDGFFGLMEEFPNLRMDTTMAVSGYFPLPVSWEKVEKFSGRILYGSDFPNIPYDAATEIEAIRNAPLSAEAKTAILSENAKRLLGI